MARFVYKATDSSGQMLEGVREADNSGLVAQELQAQGLLPIEIKEKKGLISPAIKASQVLAFTQQLAGLIAGGMPLERCLAVLEELTKDRKFKMVISELRDGIRKGEKFSFNLAKHPQVFSKFYVSMVEVGEASGVLELTLKKLADFAAKEEELRGHLRSIMAYPLVMTVVGGLAIVIILTFVVPRFVLIFKELGQELPLPTILLINFSQAIVGWWWLILLLGAGGFSGLKWCLKSERWQYALDSLKLKLPLVGTLIEMIIANRFTSNIATLLKGGVCLADSLLIAKDAVGNMVISEAIVRIQDSLKGGEKLSSMLKQSQVFPDLVVHMVACGEESGSLEEMLEKVAEHYEMQIRNRLRILVALIEPILILTMGVIVAFIVASILLPIFAMSELPF